MGYLKIAIPKEVTQANEVPIKTPVMPLIKCAIGKIFGPPKIATNANGLNSASIIPMAIKIAEVATFFVKFDLIKDYYTKSM